MKGGALKPEDLDRLGQAILTLTQELWALKDRQRVLEALLEEHGVLAAEEIDAHEPDARLAERLAGERRQLIDDVIAALQADRDSN